MTHHLSNEQLGATRDRALSAGDTAAVERHLAECAGCRERFAELASLDAALASALEHDPGEAYFASFADRVGARIAREASPVAADAPRRGLAAWWGSPRRIAWAGGALGLVAVAALVLTLSREHGPQEMARQVSPLRELGANVAGRRAVPQPAEARADRATGSLADEGSAAARKAAAPSPVPAPAASGALDGGASPTFAAAPTAAPAPLPAPAPLTSPSPAPLPAASRPAAGVALEKDQATARAREEMAAHPKTQAENAAPGRVMEVRTLPSGEQEIVSRSPQAAQRPLPSPPPLKLPGGLSKPAAAPLEGQPLTRQSLTGGATRATGGTPPATGGAVPATGDAATGALERKAAPVHSAPAAPAADALGSQPMRLSRDGGASGSAPNLAICGQVLDSRGRPATGALVAVAETGGTATAGPDGAFCVDVPGTGGTLSVLAVGYRASRVRVGAANASAPLAITLEAVDVLALSAKPARGVYNYSDEAPRKLTTGAPSMARRAAIAASAAALKAGSADAWTVAAERWETVERIEPASSDAEPGFHVAEARVNAWLVGRGDARRAAALRDAARLATQAYLDRSTDEASLEVARGWYRVLEH